MSANVGITLIPSGKSRMNSTRDAVPTPGFTTPMVPRQLPAMFVLLSNCPPSRRSSLSRLIGRASIPTRRSEEGAMIIETDCHLRENYFQDEMYRLEEPFAEYTPERVVDGPPPERKFRSKIPGGPSANRG